MSDCPTTRRYPRTMREAFARDHWCSVERFRRPRFDVLDAVELAVCLAGAVFVGWLLTRGV